MKDAFYTYIDSMLVSRSVWLYKQGKYLFVKRSCCCAEGPSAGPDIKCFIIFKIKKILHFFSPYILLYDLDLLLYNFYLPIHKNKMANRQILFFSTFFGGKLLFFCGSILIIMARFSFYKWPGIYTSDVRSSKRGMGQDK
jgi:hypothetical protein